MPDNNVPKHDAPVEDWADYARASGIVVSDRVSRDSIIKALADEGVPVTVELAHNHGKSTPRVRTSRVARTDLPPVGLPDAG